MTGREARKHKKDDRITDYFCYVDLCFIIYGLFWI